MVAGKRYGKDRSTKVRVMWKGFLLTVHKHASILMAGNVTILWSAQSVSSIPLCFYDMCVLIFLATSVHRVVVLTEGTYRAPDTVKVAVKYLDDMQEFRASWWPYYVGVRHKLWCFLDRHRQNPYWPLLRRSFVLVECHDFVIRKVFVVLQCMTVT